MHCRSVADCMWRDVLLKQTGMLLRGHSYRQYQSLIHIRARHCVPVEAGQQGRCCLELAIETQPGPHCLHSRMPQWHAPLLSALAVEMDAGGTVIEYHVANLDPDDL